MTKYVDIHPNVMQPHDSISRLKDLFRSQTAQPLGSAYDKSGIRHLEAYYSEDGRLIAVVEAPDENAVRAIHRNLGLTCTDLRAVVTLISPSQGAQVFGEHTAFADVAQSSQRVQNTSENPEPLIENTRSTQGGEQHTAEATLKPNQSGHPGGMASPVSVRGAKQSEVISDEKRGQQPEQANESSEWPGHGPGNLASDFPDGKSRTAMTKEARSQTPSQRAIEGEQAETNSVGSGQGAPTGNSPVSEQTGQHAQSGIGSHEHGLGAQKAEPDAQSGQGLRGDAKANPTGPYRGGQGERANLGSQGSSESAGTSSEQEAA